jgi:multiple sugar transport system permease protein
MTTAAVSGTRWATEGASRRREFDMGGLVLGVLTVAAAIAFAFPLYWALVTTVRPEAEVVSTTFSLWPREFTLEAYTHVLSSTKIVRWYVNSLVTSSLVTLVVVFSGITCGYALSQIRFPGRRVLYWLIIACFMVPISALVVNHFLLIFRMGLLDTWAGIVIPQLIHPVVIIVYKQFFDSVPREYREAALVDGASHLDILFRLFVPMNWSVTAALAIITFISAWNNFLWPFLAQNSEEMMNVTVGITQVKDAFGIKYARELAAAVIAGLPMVLLYLVFQRQITRAIVLSGGLKG